MNRWQNVVVIVQENSAAIAYLYPNLILKKNIMKTRKFCKSENKITKFESESFFLNKL